MKIENKFYSILFYSHSNTPGEYCTMTHIKYRET